MSTEQDNECACFKCQGDVTRGDKFCRYCGEKDPASGFSWDWKEQPPWGQINVLLKPFGCRIDEMEASSDQYASRVVSIKP